MQARLGTLALVLLALRPGASGHDVLGANAHGFFGVGTPSLIAVCVALLGLVFLVWRGRPTPVTA